MNTFGTLYKTTLYGESHQNAIGVVIDGCPPGVLIDEALIKEELKQRNPEAVGTTPRKEPDNFEITSGVYQGFSTGSPIHVTIKNESVISKDYDHLKKQPRPGHADFVAGQKYKGFNDHRGGGRFSGRLTAPIVIAGSVAKMFLPYTFSNELIQVGSLLDMRKLDQYLKEVTEKNDSVGGIIKLTVKGLPVGLGEPMFEKLDSKIGQMLFSIPAVKGVEIGVGFGGVTLMGSEFNDVIINKDGTTSTNHSGGVSGGLSNGNDLVIKVFIKPTSSIKKEQQTYNQEHNEVKSLKIEGRHDVCIARRAGIVIENAVAIVLADLYLLNKEYQ